MKLNRGIALTLTLGYLFAGWSRGALALDAEALYEKLSPSVWVVVALDAQGVTMGTGSAVVIGSEQMITNCHVLMKAKAVSVRRMNTMHSAQLLHADADRDLCILRVPGMRAPAVVIAALKSLKVGQRVFALGAPKGRELTLSDGLISSLPRDDKDQVSEIQISVPISHGSSGGGLFDKDGRLIGVTTAMLKDAQNINIAMPAEWIASVPIRSAEALTELKKKGGLPDTQRKDKAEPPPADGKKPIERQMSGNEIAIHLLSLGKVAAIAHDGKSYWLHVQSANSFNMELQGGHTGTSGVYAIHADKGEVCLSVFRSRAFEWYGWSDCFKLYDLGGERFALRSVSDVYSLTYQKPGGTP